MLIISVFELHNFFFSQSPILNYKFSFQIKKINYSNEIKIWIFFVIIIDLNRSDHMLDPRLLLRI